MQKHRAALLFALCKRFVEGVPIEKAYRPVQRGHLFLLSEWVKAFGDAGYNIGEAIRSSLFLYIYVNRAQSERTKG